MFTYLLIALISVVLSWITTKIVVVIHKIFIAPLRRNKSLDENKYKSVIAENMTTCPIADEDGWYHITYKYVVDGKEYTTSVHTQWGYEQNITLYYMSDPKKAVSNKYQLGGIENKKPIFVVCTIVFFIAIVLFWKIN